MKKNKRLHAILILATSFAFTACSSDETPPVPIISFSTDASITMELSEILIIEANVQLGDPVEHSWWIEEKMCSQSAKLEYKFEKSGSYKLIYIAKNEGGEYRKEFSILVNVPVRPEEKDNNMYVTSLFEYCPAPGQFINKAPGNTISAEGIIGKKGMVTLGAWGGYVVYGFDHTVVNQTDKDDLIIYNNAMNDFSEAGIIWVMQDENGNGKPDDKWYELAGSEFWKEEYKRNYAVTYYRPAAISNDVAWKDNEGQEGFVKKNSYHTQAYYPEWIQENSYTLKGSWLAGKVDKTNPSYIKSTTYEWGYADNTNGGDRLDIANAINETGKKIALKGIDFIKVQTAVMADMGWLGELSTEVIGIADLSMVK